MKTTYDVTGMHCQSCSRKLRESLLASPHVEDAEVSLDDHRVVVDGDEQLSLAELNARAAEAGDYYLSPLSDGERAATPSENGASNGLAAGVEHEPDRSRFVYATDGRTSVLSYEQPDAHSIDLQHTFVPPADRGGGVAARLAESALNYAEAHGLRVTPTCSYVRRYIEQHPRYQPLTEQNEAADDDERPHAGDSSEHEDRARHRDHRNDHGSQDDRSWLATYQPLLLIVAYLVGGTLIAGVASGAWAPMFLMSVFMGLFFVAFSFFKLLDLRGFAEAYTSYDLIASRWLPYAYVYPFIELALGASYLLRLAPVVVNAVTLVVMLLSTAGVVNAVARGRDIQCGCLGTAFDLPMSTLTIVEDAMMAVMAAAMLIMLV